MHGAGGNREMLECLPSTLLPCSAAALNKDYGYGRLYVDSNTTLRWEYYYSTANELVDSAVITKTNRRLTE